MEGASLPSRVWLLREVSQGAGKGRERETLGFATVWSIFQKGQSSGV